LVSAGADNAGAQPTPTPGGTTHRSRTAQGLQGRHGRQTRPPAGCRRRSSTRQDMAVSLCYAHVPVSVLRRRNHRTRRAPAVAFQRIRCLHRARSPRAPTRLRSASPPASSESLYIFIYIYGSKKSQKRSKGDSFFSCSLTGLDCAPELVLVAERDRLNLETEPPSRRRHQPRHGEGFKGAARRGRGVSSVLPIDSEFALGFGISGRPTPQNPHETSKPTPHFLPWARQQKPPHLPRSAGASQPACPSRFSLLASPRF